MELPKNAQITSAGSNYRQTPETALETTANALRILDL